MLVDISGPLGSGKTLFMTYLATKVKGRPVYANYHLKMPNYHELKLDQPLAFKNEEALSAYAKRTFFWNPERARTA
ncbi:MAG: hypothetical protein ABSD42_02110 [Candidatus Bathyarchaeia archaeon]|jgi:uridine kinase